MLNHPTIDKLATLRLEGMAASLREQLESAAASGLTFEERLGLMIDRELTVRETKRLGTRLKRARLRQSAAVEDIDFRSGRGLDRQMILGLASCDWVRRYQNVIITGPTGAGKGFVGCALAHKACHNGFTVGYHRLPRLVEDLQLARGDGRFLKLITSISRQDVLVLDDWGLAALTAAQQRDLLEILDDRHQRRSTIVTSQLPPPHWHESMADPTIADAILDRLVHNAHHITLKGESMRKRLAKLTDADHSLT
jgi:DNA replication protein DnaC